MHVEISALTTRGRKSFNEDRACVRETILCAGSMELEDGSPLMLAAFDGVSYGGQGSIAAQVVAEVFCETVGAGGGSAQMGDVLQSAATEAQRKLAQLKRSYDVDRTAACTASGLCLEPGGTLTLFNAGDSGVFRMRGGLVVKLTRDHTVVNRLRDNGAPPELIAEAMEVSAHVITRAFGMDDMPSPVLDLKRSKYVAGDVFVVCTDGLSDVLGAEEMADILSEQADKPAQRLVERALAQGATDNVTAIVARMVD